MKVLICGSRDFNDRDKVYEVMTNLIQSFGNYTVIHGCARGADSIAGDIAHELGLEVEEYPAAWNEYGRAAGHIRNAQMLKEGRPNMVIAFSYDLANSKGTKNMVRISVNAEVPTFVVDTPGGPPNEITEILR